MPSMRRCGGSSHRYLDSVVLPVLSQPHSTGRPSAKRYDKRYEVKFQRDIRPHQLPTTIADVALYVYPRLCPEGGYDLEGSPTVRAWLERIATLPGYVPPPG